VEVFIHHADAKHFYELLFCKRRLSAVSGGKENVAKRDPLATVGGH